MAAGRVISKISGWTKSNSVRIVAITAGPLALWSLYTWIQSSKLSDIATTSKGFSTNPKIPRVYGVSLQKETPEPVEAIVKGEIPSWIDGSLFRNGPGKYELGDQQVEHFFDGLSVVHRFHITNGHVTYHNRFLKSDAYNLGTKHNRIVLREFGTTAYPDPCQNIFWRFMSWFTPSQRTDNCNISVYHVGDEVFACGEGVRTMRKIDPDTLETLEKAKLPGILAVHSTTAHPHYGEDGSVYFMGSTFGRSVQYNIVKMSPRTEQSDDFENVSVVASIPQSLHPVHPSYYHSFGMTDNYIVFLEQSFVFNVLKILKARGLNTAVLPAMEFHKDLKAKFHLVKRDTGKILPITYETEALFCFHHINAYEEAGHVVVDLIVYTDPYSVLDEFYLKNVHLGVVPGAKSESRRYVLPLDIDGKTSEINLNDLSYSKAECVLKKTGKLQCTHEIICDRAAELPQINYSVHNGKPYRYFYGIGTKEPETLVKADTRSATSVVWHEDSCFPSEPMFVGRPGATTEDDGVILSSVIDLREGHSPFLLVLDAKEFTEIARAEVPVQIPAALHGQFVPNNRDKCKM